MRDKYTNKIVFFKKIFVHVHENKNNCLFL